MSEHSLRVDQVSKTYDLPSGPLKVLDNISFEVPKGQSLAIIGPSGSGKSTLLGLCAGLDYASEGAIHILGQDMMKLSENDKAALRAGRMGFVFQAYQLVPTLTALENAMVPGELQGQTAGLREKASELLERLGLKDRLHHYPVQLSGGEQQRVAIARAFINEPELIFADEPTGNLDKSTGESIEDIFFQMQQDYHTTLILVTHDQQLAAKCQRQIALNGGKLDADSEKQ